MNLTQLKELFAAESSMDEDTGYPERNVEWFERHILPDFLGLNLNGRLADVGCGAGYFTCRYAPYFNYVVGIDFCEQRIAIARGRHARPNVRYHLSDLTDDDFNFVDRFDAVISSAFLQHVQPNLRAKVLENIASITIPDAMLVFYDEVDLTQRWDGFYGPIVPMQLAEQAARWWRLEDCTYLTTAGHGERIHRVIFRRTSTERTAAIASI